MFVKAIRRFGVVAGAFALVCGGAVATSPAAQANNTLPTGSSLRKFVDASTPQWNFARAVNHDACWPSDPLPNGNQQAAGTVKAWPIAGQGGCPAKGSNFPTFYSVKKCNDTEVRVVFNIYFVKDGFVPGGHKHDFEHFILVWKKNGNSWSRDRMLLGRHGHHVTQAWRSAESWDGSRGSAGLGREFPRIFVGWGKHAIFNHQGGLTDITSQSTNNEFRSAKYPFWANWQIETTDNNAVAKLFDKYGWGSATSNPAVMSRDLCKI